MSKRLQGHRTKLNATKLRAMEVLKSSVTASWRRDEIWQTVPHSRRGHGIGTVANSGHSQRRNDESMCWCRTQAPPHTEVGDTPEVVGEVRCMRTTMKTAVNENSELILDPLLHLQPMQLWSSVTKSYFRKENARRAAAFNADCSLLMA